MNVGQFIWYFNNSVTDSNSSTESQLFNELKTSDYSSSYSNTGEIMALTLHQSYLNNSFNTILNTSDPNNNEFTVPCPDDSTFNSSYTYFKVEDIVAQNKTIDIETGTGRAQDIIIDWSFSFEIPQSCILKNFSIALSDNTGAVGGSDIALRLFNATYNAGLSRIEPDKNTLLVTESQNIPNLSGPTWYDFIVNVDLDNAQTYGGTFFIRIWRTSSGSTYPQFNYQRNTDGSDVNNSLTYREPSGFVKMEWEASLKVGLGLYDNTPNPTAINLKINNTIVSDDVGNSGYWLKQNQNYTDNDSNLDFNISADWWDVICNVSQVQINYTKTDLSASSEFNIAGSGQTVEWNVTRNGGLNYFDSRFDNYQINFTIPDTWDEDSIGVFNGTVPKTSDSTNRSLGNGYREVNVLNAGNGTFWFLNATSDNLLFSINTYVDGNAYNILNYTNVVRFNGTFTEVIDEGILNLSVYSPSPYYLNHTNTLNISQQIPGTEFFVYDWDISDNATEYGVFITRMAWNNGTAAGLLIGDLTILGESELILESPQSFTFDASTIFNITVFFNDTGQNLGIPSADINYSLNGGLDWRYDNIERFGNGRYNITINCSDTHFTSNGPNSIIINASKSFHNNQSETINIIIIGETSLSIIRPPNESNFDSSDTFNITIKYNNTLRDEIITNPIINYSLDGGNTYRWDNIVNIGNNKYNITINCNDTHFGNYGLQNIIVNASKQYYYSQSRPLSITITGNTGLTLTKWPDKTFYYSDESFDITAYYYDTSRNEGITGATIEVDIEGEGLYSPTYISEIGNGNYNITINCSESIFDRYGYFNLIINASVQNYYKQSDSILDLIIGNTTLTVTNPLDGSVFIDRQLFNITIQYNDVVKDQGILGAYIYYSLNEGVSYRNDNVTYIGGGSYNITIYAKHTDFNKFGFIDIIINASKQYHNNLSNTLTIHRQITTEIDPSNNPNLGSVIRGLNISYIFNYSDYINNPIIGASWGQVSPTYGFDTWLKDWANGTYTIYLNTTYVDVSGSPYTYIFSIYAVGNETQTISLTIDVTIIETQIESLTWNPVIARNSGLNQTIRFYFNDITKIEPVLGLTTSDIRVTKYATGTLWNTNDFNWKLANPWNNGTYILNVSTNGLDSGMYTLGLNISKFPNYNISLTSFTFYLRGNYTQFNLISISDPGGALLPIDSGYHYRIFEGSNITLEYSSIDLEFYNNTVLDPASSYFVRYKNLNTGSTGTLQSTIQYDYPNHIGDIITSNSELVAGNYLINISTAILNYENTTFSFNITIIEKYGVKITVIDQPTEVTAGSFFNITLKAEYYDGSVWLPLLGVDMTTTTYFGGIVGDELDPIYTNSSGIYVFRVITIEALNITLIARIPEKYNHLGDTLEILDIKLNPIPPGLTFEAFIPILIIIGATIAVAGGSIGVYRGVIVPKKREKSRVLKEVKTIFDDAINLEHILVLYKGTGTCIFFKSFGSEGIDPELISGFISAICSFGKDLVCQEELNEITYGDKMLLLSDGEFIRIALVLSKKASIILRKNLMDFINGFEKSYASELPNWRGQLNVFRNAGRLVDEILSTSIILPHEITYEFSNIKALKSPHSKDVLKVANTLLKDSDRSFFFIATLLKEATEKTHKDTAEIFMGIKELRDKKILIPIEIAAIEAQPISQQELALINQKVAGLVNLSQEEKQKLVNDLAQVGPAEREAYFASLMEQHEIVSAPIEEKPGAILIDNVKGAKKEIRKLKKMANTTRKEKDYGKTINIYQNAARIATSWELTGELEQLNEFIRLIKIEDLRIKMKTLEKEAKLAAKEEKYNEAAQKYKMSSKIASEIFKLGGTELTKEVKRLSNKSKEYEKLI